MKRTITTFAILISWVGCAFTQEQSYTPDPYPGIAERLEEWRDLKFGMLVHWGPYSQWGIVESWSICPEDLSWATGGRKKEFADLPYFEYLARYEGLKKTFNPVRFDPEKWAKAAKNAGMKYLVFTTKHHDGFTMWDSKYTDYKVTDEECPFHANPNRNIAKEVFNAFRKEGLWVGAYFSKPDWHTQYYWWDKFPPTDRNPSYSIQKHPDQWNKFMEFTHGQIDELVSDMGKMDILWLDGGWGRPQTQEEGLPRLTEEYEGSRYARNDQSQDIDMPGLVKKIRAKQPALIVVDRAVPGPFQDYLTPEQHIPETGLPYPWETCMTMGGSWTYTPNDRFKSLEDLIWKLADIVSKGGNLLLGVGPDGNGEFVPEAYARLAEMGKWLEINGEAIYGTRMNPETYHEGENIRFTQSKDGKTHYVLVRGFPQDGMLRLEKLQPAAGATIRLLGQKNKLKWKPDNGAAVIRLGEKPVGNDSNVFVLKVEA